MADAGAPTLILPATPDEAGDVLPTHQPASAPAGASAQQTAAVGTAAAGAAGVDTAAVGVDVGAYVSYPRCGKHVAFAGTLLHGCPARLAAHAFRPTAPTSTSNTAAHTADSIAADSTATSTTTAADVRGIAAGTSSAAAAGGGGGGGGDTPPPLRLTFLVNLWRRHRPCGPQPLPRRVATALGATPSSSSLGGEEADGGVASSFVVPTATACRAVRATVVSGRGVPSAASAMVAAALARTTTKDAEAEAEAEAEARVECFRPSAARKRASPAARAVAVRGALEIERAS